MSTDYACLATIERGPLTLKRLRSDFANPERLVGCGEFQRLNTRELKLLLDKGEITLAFTITYPGDIAEAADRAARIVRTLAQGQGLIVPPLIALAVTRREETTRA